MKILKPKAKKKKVVIGSKPRVVTSARSTKKVKVLPPAKKVRSDKIALIKKKIDSNLNTMGARSIWCDDYGHWKDFIVCGLTCDPPCSFFLSYRWLCRGYRCTNYDRCKKRAHRCDDMKKDITRAEKGMELYRKWRKTKDKTINRMK